VEPKAPAKPTPLRPPPSISISQDLARKANLASCGLGRHTISDFLHQVRIFPGTPSYVICVKCPDLFDRLRAHLPSYMVQFADQNDFLRRTGTVVNSENPFAFNTDSNNNYISGWIDVFRRVKVKVFQEDYNAYLKEGLFDPDHTIGRFFQTRERMSNLLILISGEPYPRTKWEGKLLTANSCWVRVFYRGGKLRCYSIIRAKAPKYWCDGPKVHFLTYSTP
jgi:hypothetical protein